MEQSKIKTETQVRLTIQNDHLKWIQEMETKNVDRHSIINLALDMLRPRLENICTSDDRIVEVLLMKDKIDNF